MRKTSEDTQTHRTMMSTVSSELIRVVLVGSSAGDKLCNAGENRQGF